MTAPGPPNTNETLLAPEETNLLLSRYMQAQADLSEASDAANEAQQKADDAAAAFAKAEENLTKHFDGLKAKARLIGRGEWLDA